MRQSTQPSIFDVKNFWEQNPLFSGESALVLGSKEFFEEHRQVIIQDAFAGKIDERIFPDDGQKKKVLDLGCGPGFWPVELWNRGCRTIVAADLTDAALCLAKKRANIYGVEAQFEIQNAEDLTYLDGTFSHVNCQGVIHHTPKTEQCLSEIARVLESQGTASISVYYKNFLLRNWTIFSWAGRLLFKIGARLNGRGREAIFSEPSPDEIVRLYDGINNPIGKAYTEQEFKDMLLRYFEVKQIYYHFFPARSLPFRIPKWLHRFLDRKLPFMIYVNVTKKR